MGRTAKLENLPPLRVTYALILEEAILFNRECLKLNDADTEFAEEQKAIKTAQACKNYRVELVRKIETLKTLYRVETGHDFDDFGARMARRAAEKID